jgi:hypothetical protein
MTIPEGCFSYRCAHSRYSVEVVHIVQLKEFLKSDPSVLPLLSLQLFLIFIPCSVVVYLGSASW